MNYEFSLNKTAMFSLVAGSIIIGILMFGAGLVVGSQWLTASAASADAVAKNESPDVPAEPVLNEAGPAAPKANAPKKVIPDAAPTKPAVPAPQQHIVAPAAQAAAGAQVVNGGIEIIQEAAADPSADGGEAEPEYV